MFSLTNFFLLVLTFRVEQRKFDRMPLSKIAGLIETGELRREDLVQRDC